MQDSTDRTAAGALRLAIETLIVAGIALVWFCTFRRYGFDLVDEGTLLAQIARVHAGEQPYVDFETGYTPLFFRMQVLAWNWLGPNLLASRTLGVGIHVATLTLLFLLLRQWASLAVAVGATAVVLAFLHPVSLAFGGFFNVPYPGWPAAFLLLVVQGLVMLVASRRLEPLRRAGLVFGAGIAAGLAFSIKPNSGLLALAGALLALASSWPKLARVDRLGIAGLCLLAPLATALLLGQTVLSAWGVVLLVPVTMVVAAVWRGHRPVEAALRFDLPALVAGFVLPLLTWLPGILLQIGFSRGLKEVLLIDGGGVIEAYLLPFPWPPPATLAALAGVLAAGWLGAGRGAPLAPLALGLGAALFTALLVSAGGSARLAVETTLLWLGPVGLMAGALSVGTRGGRAGARERAALAFAAVASVQFFPRGDLIHLAMIVPSLVLAMGLSWQRSAVCWRRERRHLGPEREATPLPQLVLGAVLLLSALRAGDVVGGLLEARLVPLLPSVEASPFVVVEHAAPQWFWLDKLLARIKLAAPGPIAAFPDLAGVGVLAGRAQPWRYLYFVPGRPDNDGETQMLAELEATPPAVVVIGAPSVPVFADAPRYFARLVSDLRQRAPEVALVQGPGGVVQLFASAAGSAVLEARDSRAGPALGRGPGVRPRAQARASSGTSPEGSP